jgi:L-iditol 2-dehydrogenase
MMAAVLYGKEDVKVESVAVPDLDPGDVLVRVRAALTCGTDVKVFKRGYHAKMIVPPALFGHELSGDIIAVGDEVTNFRVGQRVVAGNSAPCGKCAYCRRGSENLCEDLLFNNGAYAEYMKIPKRIVDKNLYVLQDQSSYQDAALSEPLACVLKGIEDTGLRQGDVVAVIGLGPIGLMFVRMAKVYGAKVVAIGRRQGQLDRAAKLGADFFVNSAECDDVPAEVKRLTDGIGVDTAIEAVGKPETWEAAVKMLRRGGVVNFFGGCPSDTRVGLDTQLLHYSEITCKASFHHTPAYIAKALSMVEKGYVTARDFITAEEPLENLLHVLKRFVDHNGLLKTAIIPPK